MITKQTIELNDNERLALQKALGIIDNIAVIVNVPKSNVFDYLCEIAVIEDDNAYHIKAIHNIDEIRKRAVSK